VLKRAAVALLAMVALSLGSLLALIVWGPGPHG
jgi:hypothetical protein